MTTWFHYSENGPINNMNPKELNKNKNVFVTMMTSMVSWKGRISSSLLS